MRIQYPDSDKPGETLWGVRPAQCFRLDHRDPSVQPTIYMRCGAFTPGKRRAVNLSSGCIAEWESDRPVELVDAKVVIEE